MGSYFMCAVLALGVIAKLAIGIFKGGFPPWQFWPAAVVSFLAFSFTGFCLLILADCIDDSRLRVGSKEPPIFPYRWGRIQGVLSCAYGFFIFVPALDAVNLTALTFSSLCIVSGIGLATRKKFGVGFFYITFSCFAAFACFAALSGVVPETLDAYARVITLILFWFIPAGLYYPKRLPDFD